VIYIHRPLAAIGHKFTDDLDRAVLMTLPFAALRSRILIPLGSADQVGPALSIHVDGGDAFGVVRT